MLGPANENSSKSSKPDASDLLLETNSVANTIVLLTYVVLSNILQNNRSWPQIVRLLNVSAFSVKACQHRLGTAKKKITDPLFFLYTSCMQSFYFKFHNSGELFLIWFISSWQKLVNCSAVLLNGAIPCTSINLWWWVYFLLWFFFLSITGDCICTLILKMQWQLFMYSLQR